MGCSLPGSSIHGIFQARVLEWGAIAFSEEFKDFKQKMKQTDLLVKTEYLNYPLQVIFQALQEVQSCMGIF